MLLQTIPMLHGTRVVKASAGEGPHKTGDFLEQNMLLMGAC